MQEVAAERAVADAPVLVPALVLVPVPEAAERDAVPRREDLSERMSTKILIDRR